MLKSDSHISKIDCIIQVNESLLKMMKIAFYFMLKAFFILKIFNFFALTYLISLSCRKSSLTRKISLISKFMMPQPCQQTITKHVLPNISQSKGNQVAKFGQIIMDNKRNIFALKSCRNL